MGRLGVPLAAVLVLLALGPRSFARDLYVVTNGVDAPGRGGPADPYRTIKYAVAQASAGDVVRVRAGTYNESSIRLKSGLTVLSEDGPRAAKVYSGDYVAFRFTDGVSDAEVRGFEVYGNYSKGPAQDALVRAYACSNVRIRDVLVHDAPNDCDCIKIGGSSSVTTNVLIENCIVYNPSPRPAGGYQECIDLDRPDGATVRNCWLYHAPDRRGVCLIDAKGGARNILWENNVFGPVYSAPDAGASTSAGGPESAVFPSCENLIARNNLFLYCDGDAALALASARNVEFYNNIIWCYRGGRAPVEFWTAGTGTNANFKFYNNIIYNSFGKGVFGDRGYRPSPFEHDYNLYYQVPHGGDVDLATETHGQFGVDPKLKGPAIPVPGVDTWASAVGRFGLLNGSPAVEKGLNLGSLVPADVCNVGRPVGATHDVGPHEFLLPGDVNRDGRVDVFDVIALVLAFGSTPGSANWNPGADIDRDGQVTVFDVVSVISNFGRAL